MLSSHIRSLRFFSQAKLFTPGPLSTTMSVKQAMLVDVNRSRHMVEVNQWLENTLLSIAGLSQPKYRVVFLQGSGTFTVEGMIGSTFNRNKPGKSLVVANGAYGERVAKICQIVGIPHKVLRYEDNQVVRPEDVEREMDDEVTHVFCVHSETTSGLLNPIVDVGQAVKGKKKDAVYLVDAVSSFGGVDFDFKKAGIDYLATSSNKLLQGVPGFGIVFCNTEHLDTCEGNSHSWGIDIYLRYQEMLRTGEHIMLTPPFQPILAFRQALEEFLAEGGVKARQAKYQRNQRALQEEMSRLGFQLYINPAHQGWIINTYLQPKDPRFSFKKLYNYLADRGMLIYPGKVAKVESFRIGTIGELTEADMRQCAKHVKEACEEMGLQFPLNN